MENTTKLWIIAATLLIFIGSVIFVVIMSIHNWDFKKISTKKFTTNIYEISEDFNNLSFNTDTADIKFEISNNNICKVECYEEEKSKHNVKVQSDTLFIEITNKKSWYDYIEIAFDSPKITVYLPKSEYKSLIVNETTGKIDLPKDFAFESTDISSNTGNVNFSSAAKIIKIKTTTGSIKTKNLYADTIELSASTGKISVSDVNCKDDINIAVSTGKTYLSDVKCRNLITKGSTGDISLNNVIASEKFSIKRSTGNIRFESSDASEISVETDTGKVSGNLLTNKIFITHTETGNIKVPESVTGGKCNITTDTGDIKLDIKY